MQNLVWVASFPKSGNTWVRLFFGSLMRAEVEFNLGAAKITSIQCSAEMLYYGGRKRASDYPSKLAVLLDREQVQRDFSDAVSRANPGKKILVKSHSFAGLVKGVSQIAAEATAHAILIVRNPFDVCLSVCSHFGMDADQSIEFMNNPRVALPAGKQILPMFMSSWRHNVLSWVARSAELGVKLERYEDLVRFPITRFQRLAKDVAGITDERRILKALKDTRFDSLKAMEQESGFSELSVKAPAFFVSGKIGKGFDQLTPDQRERLYRPNEDLCRALGYHYDGNAFTLGKVDAAALRALARPSRAADAYDQFREEVERAGTDQAFLSRSSRSS